MPFSGTVSYTHLLYSQKDKEQLAEELRDAEKKLTRISQRSPQLAEEKRAASTRLASVQEKVDTTTNYKINSEISSAVSYTHLHIQTESPVPDIKPQTPR